MGLLVEAHQAFAFCAALPRRIGRWCQRVEAGVIGGRFRCARAGVRVGVGHLPLRGKRVRPRAYVRARADSEEDSERDDHSCETKTSFHASPLGETMAPDCSVVQGTLLIRFSLLWNA
jgi:hypothetical protein